MFGLVDDERLYLKTSDLNRADFTAENCEAFSYPRGDKIAFLPYHAVPERLLDAPEEFAGWACKAHAVAIAARKPAAKRR